MENMIAVFEKELEVDALEINLLVNQVNHPYLVLI